MEGWLYGLFALIGVLFGGLFSYLSMKKQLKQQGEIDSRQWRRNVRSKPLLKLRDELARAAIKESEVPGAAYAKHLLKDVKPKEELDTRLERAIRDRNDYSKSGILRQILYTQTDQELINRVKEIVEDYQSSHFTADHYVQFGEKDRQEGIAVFERNEARIIEVQELINKRLEEL